MKLSLLLALPTLLASSTTAFFVSPHAPRLSTTATTPTTTPTTTMMAANNWFGGAGSVLTFPGKSTSSSNKAATAEKVKTLKQELYSLAKGKDNGLKATPAETEAILALATQLNKMNQEKNIAKTTKVDGKWRLVFTTTKGSSGGKLGPFVGEVLQEIDTAGGVYVNFVRLFGGLVEGALEAGWEVKGANEWKVIFNNITFRLFGLPVVDKKPLGGQVGLWKLTYLDEDLRILTAAGMTNQGKPAKASNIYILRRV